MKRKNPMLDGPWQEGPYRSVRCGPVEVCTVQGGRIEEADEVVRVIAAAPDMLNILTCIIEVDDAGADISFLIEEARAILDKVNPSKARGES